MIRRLKMSEWFLFDQNNSGGSFVVDKEVCHRVFIEADSEGEAEEKAFYMGIYYDGVMSGMDCPCCGDRWYSADKKTFPYKYSKGIEFESVEEYAQYLADEYGWTKPDARLFYKDGTVKEIFMKD
jgi:hypothetical protein